MKVAIQGYKGSFHHQVAGKLGLDSELVFCGSFPEVFDSLDNQEADLAIVAIENSVAGSILENFDRIKNSNLQAIGEFYLRIVMNLIAYPGQSIKDIVEVRSHPMALKQCEEFLLDHPKMHAISDVDTAKTVEDIMEGKLKGVAGIASSIAAFEFGAEILQSGIETDPHNYTRFLILARPGFSVYLNYKHKQVYKTSLFAQTKHEPGALLKALTVLQDHSVNMTNLVSRPVVGKPWHYGFYIDFEAEVADVPKILDELLEHSEQVKLLGTYPAFDQKKS